ncbi:hypothetical protein EV175_002344 [Coemansia sp. RSA 1933]|nr:hypothetical protein EV175_002344 [Coemansia sp. RSA 1933]
MGQLSAKAREAVMYPLFKAFVMLPYVILPYEKADYKPNGSDDRRKIDSVLGLFNLSNPIKQQENSKYKDMFAIIEMKRDESASRDAYIQLFDYTRNIYANQD